MTRTLRNFDSAGEDQLSRLMQHAHLDEDNNNFDPPARERPADGNWPQRESLSFTRSLVFYGNGSITAEHEEAARYVEKARAMRKKYYDGCGVTSLLSSGKLRSLSTCSMEGSREKSVKFDDETVPDEDTKVPADSSQLE